MPCSDGSSYTKESNLTRNDEMPLYPNSMNLGYIPRCLKRYGKEELAKAVRKARGLVVERFDIADRGFVREGAFADLVVLDWNRLRSFDKEENPLPDPQGIEYVLVNGQMAVEQGALKAFVGSVLRKGE